MDRTYRLAVVALLTMAATPPPAPDPGPTSLVVAVPPGPFHDTLRRLLLKPYADATQTPFADPPWDGKNLDALKTAPPDLAVVDGTQLVAGCRAGAFRKLDWSRLNRDRYFPQAVSDCGAGAYLSAIALTWDHDKFTIPPLWSDFWDVARHPGRRALQRTGQGTLEIALLADGVSPGDVYKTLRTPDGLDRAFRKLDQLKPYIQWWDQPSQPAQWLAAGKVLLAAAPTSTVPMAGASTHKRLAIQWLGSLTSAESFVVPQNAPHPSLSAIALTIAADPARQAMLGATTGLGPAIREGVVLLPAQSRGENVATRDNLAGSLAMDDGFWADNTARLEARFAAWLSK